MSTLTERWLLDLVREFKPKVVPLDVTPEGTYEESTTRWGLNPTYEAVPRGVRDVVESFMTAESRAYIARIRDGIGSHHRPPPGGGAA